MIIAHFIYTYVALLDLATRETPVIYFSFSHIDGISHSNIVVRLIFYYIKNYIFSLLRERAAILKVVQKTRNVNNAFSSHFWNVITNTLI